MTNRERAYDHVAFAGSLQVIQTASIAAALPVIFLLLVVTHGASKGLSKCWRNEDSLTDASLDAETIETQPSRRNGAWATGKPLNGSKTQKG
jgi:choline-glycine betaine transporter